MYQMYCYINLTYVTFYSTANTIYGGYLFILNFFSHTFYILVYPPSIPSQSVQCDVDCVGLGLNFIDINGILKKNSKEMLTIVFKISANHIKILFGPLFMHLTWSWRVLLYMKSFCKGKCKWSGNY